MEWPQATTGACQKGKYQNMHAPVFFMYREQKQGPITCTTVRFTNEQTYDTCLYVKVFWNIHTRGVYENSNQCLGVPVTFVLL